MVLTGMVDSLPARGRDRGKPVTHQDQSNALNLPLARGPTSQ